MTIKTHIAISATISLVLIAIIACQQKTQAPEKQDKTISNVSSQIQNSTKNAENIATKEIEKAIDEGTSMLDEKIQHTEEKFLSLSEINKSDIKEAELIMDVYEVNGGAYSNKIVKFNGLIIGLLPCNATPIKSWQTVSIKFSNDAINSIGLTNSIGISDKTGDCYNFRNLTLKVVLNENCKLKSIVNTNTFSSVTDRWPYKQGKTIKLDGSPFTYIFTY